MCYKRLIYCCFLLLLPSLVCAACVSQSAYDELQREYNKLSDENESLKIEIEQLRKELKLYHDTFGEVHEEGAEIPYLKPSNDGGTEPFPVLTNNPDAVNPTWDQLSEFLKNDKTEKIRYWDKIVKSENLANQVCECEGNCDYGIFTCTDFAVTLHDNAEAQGIRAAVVVIGFEKAKFGHVLNAFEVDGEGLVYVDCVGNEDCSAVDKIDDVELGSYLRAYVNKYGENPSKIIDSQKPLDFGGSFLRGEITNVEIFW